MLLIMGKEKGFSMSSVKTSDMRRFLERQGYVVQPSHHKHLKLKHDAYADVLLPLKPTGNLSQLAVKQIAAAMGLTPDELVTKAK
jgi:predicted RNA binding protein YcfA (HicA-like mRNA interferase family)